jgi:hypothetical protein
MDNSISEEPIREELRPQIARQLELLVEGQLPELLTWACMTAPASTCPADSPSVVAVSPGGTYVTTAAGAVYGNGIQLERWLYSDDLAAWERIIRL